MPPQTAALLVWALVLAGPGGEPATLVRVAQGSARIAQGDEVRSLDPRAGAQALRGEGAALESGAHSQVELVWRGQASATIQGPAAFELTRAPGLSLASFQTAELEVRRGKLALTLAGLGSLELSAGALQVRSLPGGLFELLNRGGSALELERAGAPRVRIAAGQRLRLRALGS